MILDFDSEKVGIKKNTDLTEGESGRRLLTELPFWFPVFLSRRVFAPTGLNNREMVDGPSHPAFFF